MTIELTISKNFDGTTYQDMLRRDMFALGCAMFLRGFNEAGRKAVYESLNPTSEKFSRRRYERILNFVKKDPLAASRLSMPHIEMREFLYNSN